MSQSLIDKIENLVNNADGFITKGQIYDLCEQEGYSPENGARRARELAEDGKILVDTYKGKRGNNLARYGKLGTEKPKPPIPTFIEKDGVMHMIYQP